MTGLENRLKEENEGNQLRSGRPVVLNAVNDDRDWPLELSLLHYWMCIYP
jgi:hypothetical protein